jgi:CheY-like chemotaxis protein
VALHARRSFDVVVMDVQMPVMSGLEATRAIRAAESKTGRRTRIVAMTAHAMASDRARCLEAGMDDYLAKPVEPAALFAAVEAGDAPPAPQAEATPRDAGDPVDLPALKRRLGGDQALMAEVCELFLEDCAASTSTIAAAVERGDAARIRAAAHALKGSAANLSADMLALAARALEDAAAAGRLDETDALAHALSAEAGRVLTFLRQPPAALAAPPVPSSKGAPACAR